MTRRTVRLLRAALVLVAGAALRPCTLAAQRAAGVPRVSLAEARQRAVAVDPTFVAARGDEGAAAWERRSAWADLLTPQLTAATSYTRYSDPFFSFTGPSRTVTTASLEARYTLLGAGKFAELRRAKAAAASAAANVIAARFRTALVTDAAYYTVLAESELARAAADRLRRATEQLGVARVRVQAGETIATDSLQLLLEVNRARLDVLQRDSALAVSRLRLGRHIGMAGPVDAVPLDSASPAPLPLALDAAVAELRGSGPALVAARATERRAAATLGVERGGYLPDVTLSAAAAAYDSEFFPEFLQRSSLALTVSVPIWDGGRREVAVARARAERDRARAERDDRERGAAQDMVEAYNGYETARARIELARVGLAASAETYRVQGARYREGATTILDLLEAQVGLSEAEAALVQARYGARLALAQIEALLGRRLFDPIP